MTRVAASAPVREALEGAVDALAASGVEDARLDAELLLCEATGWERSRLATDPGAGISGPAARSFAAMVRRRTRREPLAYITGRKGFRRIEVAVDRRALIPRPETELLVELALELGPETILDVGPGSGVVALAIADELPGARVVATDTSSAALALARENARRLGLAERVRFEQGTIPAGEPFELLVANLPYVRESEWETLAPEIREYEPRAALVAGRDGLDAIRDLFDGLTASSERPRTVGLEVGAGQARGVTELAGSAGFGSIQLRRDLADIERVVVATR